MTSQLEPVVRKTIHQLCELFEREVGTSDGTYLARAAKMFPTGYNSLRALEERLHCSFAGTPLEYQDVCARIVAGYSSLIVKVNKTQAKGAKK